MDEVTGPVIAIALVLCAVFVPTAFIAGISGQFFKQFALTIAASTVISAFNSLTLSPRSLCRSCSSRTPRRSRRARARRCRRLGIASDRRLLAYLFPRCRPVGSACRHAHGGHGEHAAHARWLGAAVGAALGLFAVGAVAGLAASARPVNRVLRRVLRAASTGVFDRATNAYGRVVSVLRPRQRRSCCCVYGGLLVLTVSRLRRGAGRLHPGAGQGLPGRQRPAPRRRQPGAHRRGRARA